MPATARPATPATAAVKPLTLSVGPQGKVYISPALYAALHLEHGQLIELAPPRARNGGTWHLDIRPLTPLATLTASLHSHTAQFEMRYPLSPRHFKNPRAKGLLFKRLVLELVSGQPLVPGYFPLKPNYALSTPK